MLTSRLIACECRFQCLSVYCASPAAFFVSVCVCVHHTVQVCVPALHWPGPVCGLNSGSGQAGMWPSATWAPGFLSQMAH